jgi:tetratricopeptide (TPR) repeat protein
MKFRSIEVLACILAFSFASTAGLSQSFGAAKEKILLQRRLPALTHLSGTTINVKATAHKEFADLAPDLESLLETELLKNDPHLSADGTNPSTIITCQITDYTHPRPIVTTQQGMSFGKKPAKPTTNTRITGTLSVSFQARSATGKNLSSDTVTAKYDETFDSGGNDISHGIAHSMTGGWKKLTGGGAGSAANEELSPPTDAELRSRLISDVVHRIASHLVNTNETIEVYLAKDKGAIEQGDKEANAGLWERALETFETAPPSSKPGEDAYRLYNIGVAYEALAYKAEDQKAAMKFLDEAAINYGKAIDAKPDEKYFLDPQKRIETAIAHYKRLEDEENEKARAAAEEKARKEADAKAEIPVKSTASTPAAKSPAKALTNDQVIAMIKAGVDDDTVAQTIRASKLARFDLSASGLQALSTSGVSDQVLKAMKVRAAHRTVAEK